MTGKIMWIESESNIKQDLGAESYNSAHLEQIMFSL